MPAEGRWERSASEPGGPDAPFERGGGNGPHSDWDGLDAEPPPTRPRSARGPDPWPLFAILEAVRGLAPRELQGQANSLIREFLLTLRALIDWYLERLDRGPREPKVEEIPID